MRILVAYVPVLHEGYRRFFESVEGAKTLYLLGPDLIAEHPVLSKEIRQLDPELMRSAVEALGIFERVEVLDNAMAAALNKEGLEIVLPDEEVGRSFAKTHVPNARVSFSPIFLRWDKHNALKERPVVADEHLTKDELHRRLLGEAEKEAAMSSDIWRHVGAIAVRDGSVLFRAHNAHLPSEHTPYVHGDPRNNFHKGEGIEYSSALHAEAGIVVQAARAGVSLEGADMYLTVFPCPPCAKLLAGAGIRTLYCGGGYGVLDGEDILKSAGVSIVFVD